MKYAQRIVTLALACTLGSCNKPTELQIRYHLQRLTPSDVVRVETLIAVDPTDGRKLFADQPYRSVAQGVGYEVRDFDNSGERKVLVTFDATLGFVFSTNFQISLLPPVGQAAPKLVLSSRAVGASADLSQVVTNTASFAPGGAVDVTLTDGRCGAALCASDQKCCNDRCIRPDVDVANCGGCGMACGSSGDGCSGSLCRCAGGSACTNGQSCCAGLGCVDLTSDPFHCGSCSKKCNPGESCVNSSCQCGASGNCDAYAIPLCCSNGMCSTNGGCLCGAVACTAPSICCGTSCVNPTGDNNNCGTCGHSCTLPLTCNSGSCTCNGTICTGSDTCCASGCANLHNDPRNCGQCGHSCNPGETCGTTASGSIDCLCGAAPCSAGQTCCNGVCVDTKSDSANCGRCGNSCRTGEACVNSACSCNGGGPCTANQTCCGPQTLGGGGCFDLSNGPGHCGSCNNPPCPAGQMCHTGMCVPSSCNPSCDHGNVCDNGVCKCNGATGCTGNLYCCASGCVDLLSDPKNCQSCGNVCADPLCCNGACTPYSSTACGSCTTVCSGTCCLGCTGGLPFCSSTKLCPLCPV